MSEIDSSTKPLETEMESEATMEISQPEDSETNVEQATHRTDFTSELFKIELNNVGKFGYGVSINQSIIFAWNANAKV